MSLLIALGLSSCGNKQENTRPIEQKNSQSAGAFEAYSVSVKPMMVLNYHISVQMNAREPCTGEVTLELMNNFSLNFPKGMEQNSLLCFGILPVPLGLILSGVSGGIMPDTKDEKGSGVSILSKASHDGKILYLSDLGSTKFDPRLEFNSVLGLCS